MRNVTFDEVLEKVNQKYKELKMIKYPYKAPELFNIESDSIKAVVQTFVDIINEAAEDEKRTTNSSVR